MPELLTDPSSLKGEEDGLGHLSRQIKWTNDSVIKLAGNSDPVKSILEKTRSLVRQGLEEGWSGPPFDPFWLADFLKIPVFATNELMEARVVSDESLRLRIEYNPNQGSNRIRFSLAHEIAHTLFPDCAEFTRNRLGPPVRQDGWQLELLCNIAAAEILMPAGVAEARDELTIDTIQGQSHLYRVSTEAALLKSVRLTNLSVAAFVAARQDDDHYRIDYTVGSSTFPLKIPAGLRISKPSAIFECTAIGYTSKDTEQWTKQLPRFHVECIGLPAYRGDVFPRVAGIIRVADNLNTESQGTKFLQGDALDPRGDGFKIVAHIVNDATPNWGAGFALAVAKRYPQASHDFRDWIESDRTHLSLGRSHLSILSDKLGIFHMVAQHGYGRSTKPLIRYNALEHCLQSLVAVAKKNSASVHMPRIGTGHAGGNWSVIRELIEEILITANIRVTVYTIPGSKPAGVLSPALNDFV